MSQRRKLDIEDDDDSREPPSGQIHECGICGKRDVSSACKR